MRAKSIAGLIAVTLGLLIIPAAAGADSNTEVIIPVKRIPVVGHFYPRYDINHDREFDGNGPDIVATANLNGVETSRDLTVTLCMEAKETKPDHTRASSCETYLLYQAPPGQCIASVSQGTFDQVAYLDSDHDDEVFLRNDSPNFVQRWTVTGDTEFSNDAGERTGVHIDTFPIFVKTGPLGC